ncbi:little elongation complex subunit 2 [Nothobranchius furzeri]|uniref:Interactor of little elongator complex ELL subunit 2 n=2 Tax=Nothobranchius furzeri TaxID=105023 RepID=A0A1A8B5S1_NOTFU|nr:little elongation complex subunit 2 isoform X1 [Nothobranchius furzeri]KAF7224419.1 transcript variant X1 [Nothobranchius furzeri]
MEIEWDDSPVPSGPFFTRDIYDKYSLAPHMRELWTHLQSPAEIANKNQEHDEAAEAPSSRNIKGAAQLKDGRCISSQVSCWESCDSDDPSADNDVGGAEDSKSGRKSNVKPAETKVDVAYPDPRLPFPCVSSLTSKEQKTHVDYLLSKRHRIPPQHVTTRLNNEIMQFMIYLQDVAKICADDYNFIPQGAVQYTEELFRSCLEQIKTLPQLFQIHEMTSLTGGMFNPGLALTFEKQLLTMGKVNITDHKIAPADAQLASDYQSVSSATPPAKKAKDMHAMISEDGNAEKLCCFYQPHVCLTRDALVRLLDNHGPEFAEQWELPVVVKAIPGNASSKRTIVYIDSPFLKTEMTVRERNHIFHEESFKLSVVKNGSINVFHLMTERPVAQQQTSPESSKRRFVSAESTGLDFEVDLSDLETFGETSTVSQTKKGKNRQDGGLKYERATGSSIVTRSKSSRSGSHEETKTNMEEPSPPVVSEVLLPKSKPTGSTREQEEEEAFAGDSDDEKLIIDSSAPSAATPIKQPDLTSVPESTPLNKDLSSPNKSARTRQQAKRAKTSGDQLGEILRMQTAMFKSANDATVKSPSRCVEPMPNSHLMSLVKPCVTSYLERHQNEDNETCASPPDSAAVNNNATGQKRILSEDLQACAEDEQDYEAPEESNLLYKLYSLQDVLLLVRSSVSLTHTRSVGSSKNQYVPVHVVPKLEYQLSYGVECLTSSEACQLWTETLLHSSTVSYIAHISAHTSKMALLRKLPDDWKQNISCGFKPSKSLNILHHLLKKLTRLDEGQYLITHKHGEPFVTILKAADVKASRGTFNLHQSYSSAPLPPRSGLVPWIPVDPAVVLPFHQKHGRVPCTFPPKNFTKAAKVGANNPGAGLNNNSNAQGKKKKKGKQSKRSAKRNKYIKNLIQKCV